MKIEENIYAVMFLKIMKKWIFLKKKPISVRFGAHQSARKSMTF